MYQLEMIAITLGAVIEIFIIFHTRDTHSLACGVINEYIAPKNMLYT